MPFADWNRPSFALSQLAESLRCEFGSAIEVSVHYLNQDFAEYFGAKLYEQISLNHDHVDTGLGDWLFRDLAFPGQQDNADDYFSRFYRGEGWREFRENILARRDGLGTLCATLVDEHGLAEADVVGFSSMFTQNVPSMAAARLVKDRNPAALTLLGGANCESPMGAVIAEQVPVIDYVFSGPALQTLPKLVENVLAGRPEANSQIPGILTRANCKEPRFRRAIGGNRDINDVIVPDFSAFFDALDTHPEVRENGEASPMLFFETSRGCWWGERSHCTFCGLNGQSMAYRSMDAGLAIEQFQRLFTFAPRFPLLFCTDNVMPRHYPREVFDHLETPPGVSIYYEVKLPLSRDDLRRMARAGVNMVQPGIEALSSSTLKLMGKGTTSFHNLQFLKHCREFDIFPDWNLLIGFPGEDPEVFPHYAKHMPNLSHLPPPHGVYMVRFDRFSPYFNRRDEFGLDLWPVDYYPLIYPFDQESLFDLAYFFSDQSLGKYAIEAVSWHDRLRELVAGWQREWSGTAGPVGELRLDGDPAGGWWIEDSRRRESPARHQVDEDMVRLLRRLASPTKPGRLASEWPTGPADLTRRLRWLESHRMVFEEGGKTLSLVIGALDDQPEATPGDPGGPETGGRTLLPVIAERAATSREAVQP
ncbi:RiPP maturation radical SAM C-methyltransferase [Nonomuraea deserti]|nr:RiPP maturation radical SAM C-methyltransferase [Nonomuraea deserti]